MSYSNENIISDKEKSQVYTIVIKERLNVIPISRIKCNLNNFVNGIPQPVIHNEYFINIESFTNSTQFIEESSTEDSEKVSQYIQIEKKKNNIKILPKVKKDEVPSTKKIFPEAIFIRHIPFGKFAVLPVRRVSIEKYQTIQANRRRSSVLIPYFKNNSKDTVGTNDQNESLRRWLDMFGFNLTETSLKVLQIVNQTKKNNRSKTYLHSKVRNAFMETVEPKAFDKTKSSQAKDSLSYSKLIAAILESKYQEEAIIAYPISPEEMHIQKCNELTSSNINFLNSALQNDKSQFPDQVINCNLHEVLGVNVASLRQVRKNTMEESSLIKTVVDNRVSNAISESDERKKSVKQENTQQADKKKKVLNPVNVAHVIDKKSNTKPVNIQNLYSEQKRGSVLQASAAFFNSCVQKLRRKKDSKNDADNQSVCSVNVINNLNRRGTEVITKGNIETKKNAEENDISILQSQSMPHDNMSKLLYANF